MVQAGLNDMEGYNDANETPDRAAAESAVQVVADLYSRMKLTAATLADTARAG